jgi:hypothetical protein
VNPSPVVLGGVVDVIVTVQTGLAQARLEPPLFGDRRGLVVLALIVPLGFFVRRRKRLVGLMMVCAMLSLGGCGAGREIPPGGLTGPATPTPSGTYSLNVSASSAGITRSVALTLVVQ